MESVQQNITVKVVCVTGNVKLMQTAPREKDVSMNFVPRCVTQTRIVCREKFALTALASQAVTKKRTVDLGRYANKVLVFAQLASSILLLVVKT